MDITLRQVRYRDWRELSNLVPAIFPELSDAEVSDMLRHKLHTMGISATSEAIIGFYQFHSVTREKTPAAWLNYLGVIANNRHSGTGSQLLRYFEEKVRAMGFLRIELDVLQENTAAQRFYEKHGYRHLQLQQKPGKTKYRYAKNITADTAAAGAPRPVDSLPPLTRVTRKLLYKLLVEVPNAFGVPRRHSG